MKQIESGRDSPGRLRTLLSWLDHRLGFSALWPLLKKKEVPMHRHSFWYYIGGMAREMTVGDDEIEIAFLREKSLRSTS